MSSNAVVRDLLTTQDRRKRPENSGFTGMNPIDLRSSLCTYRWVVTIIILVGIGMSACSREQVGKNGNDRSQCGDIPICSSSGDKPIITKDIAMLIAKAAVMTSYDLKKLDTVVSEKGPSWVVEFHPKPEFADWTGGTGYVQIDKESGEVISFYFGK